MMDEARGLKALWPDRRWWFVLLAILLIGSGLRYTGYKFSLPYVVDEPAYNLAGRMIIDFGSAKLLGIVTLNYVLLRWFQDSSQPPAPTN